MNKRFKSKMAVIAGLMCLVFASSAALACTSISVSPEATTDGSAVVTQTADSGRTPYEFYYFPPADYAAGTMKDLLYIPQITGGYNMREIAWYPTGNKIPQVAHTYGYFGGIFGMMNENQVGFGESTTSNRSQSRNRTGYFDITDLSHIAAERARTAREAIQVMGDLAVKYGYKDSGEMLAICDPYEAWIFEISGPGALWEQGDAAPGAYWVAQKVPAGHVAACGNNAVIDVVNFNDSANFMYGPGMVEFATNAGWYNPASGEAFSWRKHFCNATSFATCARRVWRVFCLAAPSLAATLDETKLPFSVPVDKKLSVIDINNIQADHYEGTQYDMTTTLTAGPWNNPRRFTGTNASVDGLTYAWQRQICVVNCEYSIAATARKWLPDAIGGVLWFGFSLPDTTCYVPLYAGMTSVSPSVNDNAGSHFRFTRESLYWAISAVGTYVNTKYAPMMREVEIWREKYYYSLIRNQAAIDAAALELYKQSPATAKAFLTSYCNNNIELVKNAWWELLDYLVWKYNMGFETYNNRVNSVSYPTAWLNLVVSYPGDTDHY